MPPRAATWGTHYKGYPEFGWKGVGRKRPSPPCVAYGTLDACQTGIQVEIKPSFSSYSSTSGGALGHAPG